MQGQQETPAATPALVETLAAIETRAEEAIAMLTLAQRSPVRSRVSGRSALTAIKNMAGDAVDKSLSSSSAPETIGAG